MTQESNEAEVMKAKICLVGEAAVGKTSLIRRYVLDLFEDLYIATLGAKVTKREVFLPKINGGKGVKVNLMIWDIMGEKGFRELLKEAYFHGAQGVLAVCDVTRKDTLLELKNWIDSVTKVTGDIPVRFVVNKMDLTDEAQFGEDEVMSISEEMGSSYIMTSAKTGEGVAQSFEEIARLVAKNHAKRREKPLPPQ
ncbi:MAG: Rab family GTPase [Thermoplasmata archaeon]